MEIKCFDHEIQKDAQKFFKTHKLDPNHPAENSQHLKNFYYRWPIKNIYLSFEDGKAKVQIDPQYDIGNYQFIGTSLVKRQDVLKQIRNLFYDDTIENPVEEIQRKIIQYYVKRGFPNAKVIVRVEKNHRFKQYKIIMEIYDQDPCFLQSISFVGDSTEKEKDWIRRKLRVRYGQRCDLEMIDEKIQKVKKYLVNQGYNGSSIHPSAMEYVEDGKKGKLKIDLYVGKKVYVFFHGNRFSFEREELLKKAIYFQDEKRFSPSWIENTAIEGLERFYKLQGYPLVGVRSSQSEADNGLVRKIHFYIERGPAIRVKNLQFEGNKALSDKKLERYYRSIEEGSSKKGLYVEEDMSRFQDGLISYYNENGFLEAKVGEAIVAIDPEENEASVKFSIDEGQAYILKFFQVSGNRHLSKKSIVKVLDLKSGNAIDPIRMRLKLDSLRKEYQKLGFKYAKIDRVDMKLFSPGEVIYPIHIEEGPRIQIGNIYVKGNYTTKEKVIVRDLTFTSGDYYNPNKIRESRRNLLRLGFFSSVVIQERNRFGDSNIEDIIITIEERKKRSLVIRPGISTDDGARLSTSLGYANIAGTGRSATLSGRISKRIQNYRILEHRLVFTYLEPNVLGLFDGKFNYIDERIEEIQFDIDRKSLILGIEKSYFSWMRNTLQWEIEFRNPFNEDPDVVLSPFDQSKARFGSVSSFIDFDFRDNLLNASRGSFHRIRFDVFDHSFLSDAEFLRLNIRNSFYIPIYNRIRSVLALRVGFAKTYGKTKKQGITQIPIEKRFRLGGNDSLRGFSKNCVGGLDSSVAENCSSSALTQAPGGNSYFNYLYEILFPMTENLDLALFTDGGNAYSSNRGFNVFDIRNSIGFGFRYNTFVGPLRIDFGFPIDRRSGESAFEFHLSVGQF
ncbi:MAG: outer membrane protein assembly factor BamA [Bdellovibrionales bacterium]|nr:outer membrane protein assembly factor BamA [Bdellovibrionales bacterium]